MSTILTVGSYSFIFLSSAKGEPPHIHIKRDEQIAKFWLTPVSLGQNVGFKSQELEQIGRLVAESQMTLLDAWHDYFEA